MPIKCLFIIQQLTFLLYPVYWASFTSVLLKDSSEIVLLLYKNTKQKTRSFKLHRPKEILKTNPPPQKVSCTMLSAYTVIIDGILFECEFVSLKVCKAYYFWTSCWTDLKMCTWLHNVTTPLTTTTQKPTRCQSIDLCV